MNKLTRSIAKTRSTGTSVLSNAKSSQSSSSRTGSFRTSADFKSEHPEQIFWTYFQGICLFYWLGFDWAELLFKWIHRGHLEQTTVPPKGILIRWHIDPLPNHSLIPTLPTTVRDSDQLAPSRATFKRHDFDCKCFKSSHDIWSWKANSYLSLLQFWIDFFWYIHKNYPNSQYGTFVIGTDHCGTQVNKSSLLRSTITATWSSAVITCRKVGSGFAA